MAIVLHGIFNVELEEHAINNHVLQLGQSNQKPHVYRYTRFNLQLHRKSQLNHLQSFGVGVQESQ